MYEEIVELFSARLSGNLIAVVFFGSLTLENSERYRGDLDVALLLKDRAKKDILLEIRAIYEKIYTSSNTIAVPVCHGPVVVFSDELAFLNPILFEIVFTSDEIRILDENAFQSFACKVKKFYDNQYIQARCDSIIWEHIHEMRMCLFDHPGYCSNEQEAHNFRYHLLVAMKTMIYLKLGVIMIGGAKSWSAWEEEFGKLLGDKEVSTYTQLGELLLDRNNRFAVHVAISSQYTKQFYDSDKNLITDSMV